MQKPPSQDESKVGSVLDGRYRLDALIGEGAAGQVFRATHLALDRPVAVKLLLQEHEVSDVAQARFVREAKTLAALRHPNIVTVIDFGFSEFPFLVLELVQGCELEDLVSEGPLAIGESLSVIKQLLGALAYAHESGVIHRDLKPSNLFVRRLPAGLHVEVLDFGLAKFIGGAEKPGATNVKVTRAGHVVGTPAYMAPEQVAGDAVDERADQYAATVVLFEMLTGRLPFDAEDLVGMLHAQIAETPPSLAEAAPSETFSPELEALVARGLAKDAAQRFENVPAMLSAIEVLPELSGLSIPDVSSSEIGEIGETIDAAAPGSGRAPKRDDESSGVVIENAKRAVSEIGSAIAKRMTPPEDNPSKIPAPPKALLVGTVAVLLMALAYGATRDNDEGLDAEVATEVEEIPSATGTEAAEGAPLPEGRSVNAELWAEVPPELAPYKRILDSGRRLRRRQIGSLRSFAAQHPSDARPLILHGRAYVAQRWLSQALPYFVRAFETDIRAQQDPNMLECLVEMVSTEALERDAGNAIRRIYGVDARPAIRKAIGEQRQEVRRLRLRRLLVTLDE